MTRCGRRRPSRRIAIGCWTGDIAAAFFDAVLLHADTERLLSDEHFTVDGTLLEAWASHKSFRPRDEEPPSAGAAAIRRVDFHGAAPHQRHASVDHRSRRAAVQESARPGGAARLSGPCADGASVGAHRADDGHAGRRPRRTRRRAGDDRARCPGRHRITVAADKALRHARLCRRPAGDARHAACRAVHADRASPQRDRRPHDAASRATRSANRNGSWSSKASAG